jgi:hypothetical protein
MTAGCVARAGGGGTVWGEGGVTAAEGGGVSAWAGGGRTGRRPPVAGCSPGWTAGGGTPYPHHTPVERIC